MENFRPIYFQQVRDFSQKMNATFGFLRQNFSSLMKSLVFIAGPPIIIVSLLAATMMNDLVNLVSPGIGSMDYSGYVFSLSFWMQILAMVIFLLVAGVMTYATINCYIILYVEKQTNKISVSEVWGRVRGVFWMYVGTMFLFVVLVVGLYIVMLIPIGVLALAGWPLMVLGSIAMGCAVIYFLFSLSLTFFIRTYEKKGFFESIGRSMKLVSGKWWSTFGLIFLLSLISTICSWLINVPYYIVSATVGMHSDGEPATASQSIGILSGIYIAVSYLIYIMLQAIPNIGIAFQYFNLVELKESRGLMDQIESVGQTQAPSSTSIQEEEQY